MIDSQMIDCMVFLRELGEVRIKQGLGVHPFGRIPCVNEYIALVDITLEDEDEDEDNDTEKHFRVTHVSHTGFGSHAAELYVIEAKDMEFIGTSPLPPAAT